METISHIVLNLAKNRENIENYQAKVENGKFYPPNVTTAKKEICFHKILTPAPLF